MTKDIFFGIFVKLWWNLLSSMMRSLWYHNEVRPERSLKK